MKMSAKNDKKFRVWIDQVNQTTVEVTARDEEHARKKGYTKWRKEEAHSRVSYIAEVKEGEK